MGKRPFNTEVHCALNRLSYVKQVWGGGHVLSVTAMEGLAPNAKSLGGQFTTPNCGFWKRKKKLYPTCTARAASA